MATVVNLIDTTLQAAAARGVNLPTADIQLLPSAPLFKVAPDGSITPPSITFTATLVDLEAELTFNATGAPLTSPTARSVTVVGESMTGSSVTVIASATVNGRTYTKPCTISKVQDGTVGSTTYTWIKYADSAAGAGLSDDPTGKAYIGLAYNKPSPIESVIASDYTWSLIKGTDGQPGEKGADGVQMYTWIKYADSANGDGMYDLPTANTLYIGIAVNRTTATESSNPADYVWSRFKGDQGVPGPALYTWIKYADSAAGAGLSDDPTNKAYIGFAYNKTTAVESDNPADYTWSLNQGGQGVPGQPGKDGTTYYTWLKYSDVPDGTGLYDVPTASTMYIGIAVNKVTPTESTNKADYTWSKFRGDQGVPGNPGQPGQRGTVDISAGTAGTVWSDSEATAAIAQTGYGVPQMLDVVTLYNQAAGFANTRYWNGSAWIAVAQVINGSLLVKNTVAADKIDTRGLSIKDAAGNVILAAGSALSKDYAAPGTLNSDLTPSITAAGKTAVYKSVDGRPDDLSNLLMKSSFEDNNLGGWTALAVEGPLRPGCPYSKTITINARNAVEDGNIFKVTPSEKLYMAGWLDTGDSVYPGRFGVIGFDNAGNAIDFLFAFSQAAAVGWNYYEGYVVIPPGVVSVQPYLGMDGTDFSGAAGPAYLHAAGLWMGRHARGATVGAPSGTMVGGTDAGLVASRAAYGQQAYDALPGITSQITDKLSQTAGNVLRAPIALATGGGVVVGSLTYDATTGLRSGGTGMAITPYGMIAHNGIKYTLAFEASTGNTYFSGELSGASGTFGALRVSPGGMIGMQAESFGQAGIWAGDAGGVYKFSIVAANGAKLLFDPSDPNPLQIKNADIANSTTDVFTGYLGGSAGGSFPNPNPAGSVVGFGSLTANAVGGTGAISYMWLITPAGRVPSNAYMKLDSSSGKSVGISGTGANTTLSYTVTCIMTDQSNRTVILSAEITSSLGTPT